MKTKILKTIVIAGMTGLVSQAALATTYKCKSPLAELVFTRDGSFRGARGVSFSLNSVLQTMTEEEAKPLFSHFGSIISFREKRSGLIFRADDGNFGGGPSEDYTFTLELPFGDAGSSYVTLSKGTCEAVREN